MFFRDNQRLPILLDITVYISVKQNISAIIRYRTKYKIILVVTKGKV